MERRIFKLGDELTRLEDELAQARAERDVLLHLADDAARDAAVYDTPLDREDARDAESDVARFERLVAHFEQQIAATRAKRSELIERLGG